MVESSVPEPVQQELAKGDAEKKHIVEQTTKRQDVKPTPTQKECDLAALGQPVLEKEPDGSEPEPRKKGRAGEDDKHTQNRAMESSHPQGSGNYSTRSGAAKPRETPATT